MFDSPNPGAAATFTRLALQLGHVDEETPLRPSDFPVIRIPDWFVGGGVPTDWFARSGIPAPPMPAPDGRLSGSARPRAAATDTGDLLLDRVNAMAALLEQSASVLTELQAEFAARTASLKLLAAQIQEQEGKAAEASALASLKDEQAQAVNRYLTAFTENRIAALETSLVRVTGGYVEDLEKSARHREWVIGTVVAVVVGVASILTTHFVFGF